MPGTHYAILDSALIADRQHAAIADASYGKVECRAGKTGNLPEGLFAPASINFSVFTLVLIGLSLIYYKYELKQLILTFLWMKYDVIESICAIIIFICD